MELPARIKAEVKLTVGASVSVAARELEALAMDPEDGAGIVAALFVGAKTNPDGEWELVDARVCRRRRGDRIALSRATLETTARTQPWLEPLRRHVDAGWPAFLEAFHELAEQGHGALVKELERLHGQGALRDRLPTHRILATDHRSTLRGLVDRHGEADAGRLVQDLLAYLIAMAGYRKVTNNAVGVPDFVLEELRGVADAGAKVALALSRENAERLVRLCRASGEDDLAEDLQGQLQRTPAGSRETGTRGRGPSRTH